LESFSSSLRNAEMGFNEQGHWQWNAEDVPESFQMRYKDDNDQWLNSIYR